MKGEVLNLYKIELFLCKFALKNITKHEVGTKINISMDLKVACWAQQIIRNLERTARYLTDTGANPLVRADVKGNDFRRKRAPVL